MEDWIGIVTVMLMIPGLILLIGVVVLAVIHLKRDARKANAPDAAITSKQEP